MGKRGRKAGGEAASGIIAKAASASMREAKEVGPKVAGDATDAARKAIPGPAGKIPLKPPNSRHNLDSIRPKSPSKEVNTVVLPGTDVAKDLDDIAAGRATWDPDRQRYLVNGRTYAVEPSGTVFPEAGPGLEQLNRAEYGALKEYIAAGGDIEKARAAMARNPFLTEAAQERALEVFRHHKSYRG
ncbi:hypothetical protein EV382_2249 [Micromonospora violae]|uniref:Uncharacterized protein n=1 Tax=Micromonospora violae TaxID=1278207 RepID=A0A4Q7UHT6_9ACTN|nr:hypothetical protein [Micromonospora violae]RZT79053.1 hypothetical protein EV382_2249 [Micromonospora violae]